MSVNATIDPCAVAATEETASSAEALRAVCVTYGTTFIVLFVVYNLLRNRFPTLYNVRNSVPDLNCDLAERSYAPFAWIPGVIKVSDEELMEQCGFDAISYIRLLQLGAKLALMGCFIAIWLIPTYATAPTRESNALVTDKLDELAVGHTYSNDPRLFGTVIASYLLNFFAMYLLYNEFSWYIAQRHKVMVRESPEHYTVYVGNVPNELRSVKALNDFFAVFFKDDVVEVQFAKNIEELEKLREEHEKTAKKLKHAEAVLEHTGERPKEMTKALGHIDSIEHHGGHLSELDAQISAALDALQAEWEEHEAKVEQQDLSALADPPPSIRDGAFVSFKTLQSATAAQQIMHYGTPFALLAKEAPPPQFVFWKNVGLNHWKLQATSILAGALTLVTCVLWTIPVAFIASLAKVQELKKDYKFLADAADAWSLFDDLLAAVAPLALIVLNSLLPAILGFYCKLEGHIGTPSLQASLFNKLTLFQLVQTFFVSAISGSLFDQLTCLTNDPAGQTIRILATSLPSQAVTFMGLTIVQTTVGMCHELLRMMPALFAFIRRYVGPRLTEEERKEDFFILAPLCNPGEVDYAALFAETMLMFITLFVYAILSPISSFVMLAGFCCLNVGYRNQVIHVYDPANDTGGSLWPKAAGAVVVCMLIAQVTVVGVLGLKEGQATVPLMLPLLLCTVLFWRYLQQQHFRAAVTLPIVECYAADQAKLLKDDRGLAFLLGAYKQEALVRDAHNSSVDVTVDGSGGGGADIEASTSEGARWLPQPPPARELELSPETAPPTAPPQAPNLAFSAPHADGRALEAAAVWRATEPTPAQDPRKEVEHALSALGIPTVSLSARPAEAQSPTQGSPGAEADVEIGGLQVEGGTWSHVPLRPAGVEMRPSGGEMRPVGVETRPLEVEMRPPEMRPSELRPLEAIGSEAQGMQTATAPRAQIADPSGSLAPATELVSSLAASNLQPQAEDLRVATSVPPRQADPTVPSQWAGWA